MIEFEYFHDVRVRYADTDKMGVVYHGRYFEWFEAARTEMLRAMGLAYKQIEDDGISMPVVEATCRYRRSVTYDELVHVKTRIKMVSRSRIELEYEVWVDPEQSPRVVGSTIHCYINREGRPVRASLQLQTFFKLDQ